MLNLTLCDNSRRWLMNYAVLDVFTDRALCGNPLAVVEGADALDSPRMQAIAREFNLSETVFVLAPERGGDVRLRIFTPTQELPFAGHPTIGAACWLEQTGRLRSARGRATRIEEAVGIVPVRVFVESNGLPYAQLTTAVLPRFAPAIGSASRVAALLGLTVDDINAGGDVLRSADCGVPYNLVELTSLDALARAHLGRTPDASGEDAGAPQSFYLYHPLPAAADGTALLRARMLSFDLGVAEDPATGSAAAALCGHLADRLAERSGTFRWRIIQGVEMGRPSTLDIEADKLDGRITAIRVGGYAVIVARGQLMI
ncbi:PhzF family phenazine biosynthesis protein [Hydrocarboniphaga daqingensis]|nr:PhzF family phenazine biosynthesis protein [Hydrocarboniphaga daqingensis]